MVVATAPASRPSIREFLVDAISTASTSWPKLSVPRMCSAEGGSYSPPTISSGEYGYSALPKKANTPIPRISTTEIQNRGPKLKLRQDAFRLVVSGPGTSGPSSASATATCPIVLMSLLSRLGRADPRIDEAVQHLDQVVRHQHRDGDDRGEALDDRIVIGRDGVEQQGAQPRVVEHEFGDQCSADQGAQAECQAGDLGQHRVAEDVAGHLGIADAQATRVVDVVGTQFVDGHRPHADRLGADADQQQGQERQPVVLDGIEEEVPAELGRHAERVGSADREPTENDRE